MKENDTIFIKILEFGEEKQHSPSDFNDLLAWCSQKSIYVDVTHHSYLRALYNECFTNQALTGRHVLKTEYYFKLLEYRELSEARDAARDAKKYSLWALGVSIVSIIISCVLAYFGDVKLDPASTVQLSQETINELKAVE